MSDIVEIGKFSSEFEAQLALARLASEGITAHVVTDDGGGALPNLSSLVGGVRLIVREEDSAAAREALTALEEGEPSRDA